MKYIQVITKNGKKLRFKDKIISLKDFNPKTDIAYQKELTEEEIHMIPEVKSKKMIMRNKNPEELAAIESAKTLESDKAAIRKKISDKQRQTAIDEMLENGEITQEELNSIGE